MEKSSATAEYVQIALYKVRAALTRAAKTTFKITYKTFQFDSNDVEQKSSNNPSWTNLRLVIPLMKGDVLQNTPIKVTVLEKGGGVFGSGSVIGEGEIPIAKLINKHYRDQDTAIDDTLAIEIPISRKESGKGSVYLSCEATGGVQLLDMLGDSATRVAALDNLIALSKTNKIKLAQYMSADAVKILSKITMTYTRAATSKKDKKDKNKDSKTEKRASKKEATPLSAEELAQRARLFEFWKTMVESDVTLRKQLLSAGVLKVFQKLVLVADVDFQLHFLECFKPFFTVNAHQKELIKEKVLAALVKLVSPTAGYAQNERVQLKAFDCMMYFDGTFSSVKQILTSQTETYSVVAAFQKDMLREGIFAELIRLIRGKNIILQSKSMELIKSFDAQYQDEMHSQGITGEIIELLNAPPEIAKDKNVQTIILKSLSVITYFDESHQAKIVENGLLSPLLNLLKLPQATETAKAQILDIIRKFSTKHSDDLIKAGALSALSVVIREEPVALKNTALDLLTAFATPGGREQLIESGILKQLVGLMHQEDQTLATLAFDWFTKVEATPEELINAGFLTTLNDLLRKPPFVALALEVPKKVVVQRGLDVVTSWDYDKVHDAVVNSYLVDTAMQWLHGEQGGYPVIPSATLNGTEPAESTEDQQPADQTLPTFAKEVVEVEEVDVPHNVTTVLPSYKGRLSPVSPLVSEYPASFLTAIFKLLEIFTTEEKLVRPILEICLSLMDSGDYEEAVNTTLNFLANKFPAWPKRYARHPAVLDTFFNMFKQPGPRQKLLKLLPMISEYGATLPADSPYHKVCLDGIYYILTEDDARHLIKHVTTMIIQFTGWQEYFAQEFVARSWGDIQNATSLQFVPRVESILQIYRTIGPEWHPAILKADILEKLATIMKLHCDATEVSRQNLVSSACELFQSINGYIEHVVQSPEGIITAGQKFDTKDNRLHYPVYELQLTMYEKISEMNPSMLIVAKTPEYLLKIVMAMRDAASDQARNIGRRAFKLLNDMEGSFDFIVKTIGGTETIKDLLRAGPSSSAKEEDTKFCIAIQSWALSVLKSYLQTNRPDKLSAEVALAKLLINTIRESSNEEFQLAVFDTLSHIIKEDIVFTQGEHAYVRPPKSLAELVELISPSLKVDATTSNLSDTVTSEPESTNKDGQSVETDTDNTDDNLDIKPLISDSSDDTGSPLLGNLWKSASVGGGSSIPKPPPLPSQPSTGPPAPPPIPLSTQTTTTPKDLSMTDTQKLRQWLSWTPSMPLYFTVLYDSLQHGSSNREFHKRCDGKRSTLTLAKSYGGWTFGGYTSQAWETQTGKFVRDNEAFLFALKRHGGTYEKYPIRPSSAANAIFCDTHKGPSFGVQDLEFNLDKPVLHSSRPGTSYDTSCVPSTIMPAKLFTGSTYLDVRQVIVYALSSTPGGVNLSAVDRPDQKESSKPVEPSDSKKADIGPGPEPMAKTAVVSVDFMDKTLQNFLRTQVFAIPEHMNPKQKKHEGSSDASASDSEESYPENGDDDALGEYRTHAKLRDIANEVSSYDVWRRLYQASESGWTNKAFHTVMQDNTGPFVLIFRVDTGAIFGALITTSLKYITTHTEDDKAMLFTIRNAGGATAPNIRRMPTRPGQSAFAIFSHQSFGPCFGLGMDLCINLENQEANFSNLGCTFQLPDGMQFMSKGASSLLAGAPNGWKLVELEVFAPCPVDLQPGKLVPEFPVLKEFARLIGSKNRALQAKVVAQLDAWGGIHHDKRRLNIIREVSRLCEEDIRNSTGEEDPAAPKNDAIIHSTTSPFMQFMLHTQYPGMHQLNYRVVAIQNAPVSEEDRETLDLMMSDGPAKPDSKAKPFYEVSAVSGLPTDMTLEFAGTNKSVIPFVTHIVFVAPRALKDETGSPLSKGAVFCVPSETDVSEISINAYSTFSACAVASASQLQNGAAWYEAHDQFGANHVVGQEEEGTAEEEEAPSGTKDNKAWAFLKPRSAKTMLTASGRVVTVQPPKPIHVKNYTADQFVLAAEPLAVFDSSLNGSELVEGSDIFVATLPLATRADKIVIRMLEALGDTDAAIARAIRVSKVKVVGYVPETNESLAPPRPSKVLNVDKVFARSKVVAPKPQLNFVGDASNPFDGGLLYWLGTDGGKSHYVNPLMAGHIAIKTSHKMFTVHMKEEWLVGREAHTNYFGGTCPQWMIVDLKGYRLKITSFALRHGYNFANSYITNSELFGSNDSENWTSLWESKPPFFTNAYDEQLLQVQSCSTHYRYFKLIQYGNYTMGSSTAAGAPFFCVSGLELFGAAVTVESD